MNAEQEAIQRLRERERMWARIEFPPKRIMITRADLRTLLDREKRLTEALERIVVESEDEDYIEELHRTRSMAHIARRALEGKQ